MNRQEKLLSLFTILTLVVLECTLSAFAQVGPGTDSSSTYSWIELDSEGHPIHPPSSEQSPEISSVAPPSSQAPPSSAPPSSSSKKPQKITAKVSSVPSSENSTPSSEENSGEISSEVYSTFSSEISLPSVSSVPENNPLNSTVVNQQSTKKMKWIGVVSWAFILLGILVVLIVVLSNRRPPRGMGRSRYHKPKHSSKKRLLNDKYYRNINR